MCDYCMFILHASSACILHAVHSHSCICLLRHVACILGVIVYLLLYMCTLPSSSTVMYMVQLSYWRHAEVNFDTSLSLLMLSLCSFCTCVLMFFSSPSCSVVCVFVLGWCLCTSCQKFLLLFLDKLILIFFFLRRMKQVV